jgi:hypothetical protein
VKKITEWKASEASYIRNVFTQPTGLKFLRLIKQAIPRVTATKLEEVSIEALKKQGAEDLYNYMQSLTGEIEPDLVEGRDFIDLTKEGD